MASVSLAHSEYTYTGGCDHTGDRIALVVSQWHGEITERLYAGAIEVLRENKVEYTLRQDVPGSLELPFAAKLLADTKRFDAILLLGVVVKGETRHDEYINHAIIEGASRVSLKARIPVIVGVLTVETTEQALQRAGGTHGHKGKECALGALQMIDLKRAIENI
jgi:6,7-dimethyl-8-ribityllumazine synthase